MEAQSVWERVASFSSPELWLPDVGFVRTAKFMVSDELQLRKPAWDSPFRVPAVQFLTSLKKRNVTEHPNIVKAGANVGWLVLRIAQAIPSAHMFVLEPSPTNFR